MVGFPAWLQATDRIHGHAMRQCQSASVTESSVALPRRTGLPPFEPDGFIGAARSQGYRSRHGAHSGFHEEKKMKSFLLAAVATLSLFVSGVAAANERTTIRAALQVEKRLILSWT
jgi:hypothetical protein